MIAGADDIAAFSAGFGLQLSAAQATALAGSPLALPDLLPAVLGSMTLEALETPDDAVLDLLDEAERYLAMRLRAADDVSPLAAFAVPTVLTTAVLSALDPDAAGSQQLERAAQAGVLLRDVTGGKTAYRMHAMLRRTVLAELRRRDPGLVRELDARLGAHFRDTGAALAAIAHFSAAEDWDAAVDAIDGALFRLIADDPQRLREAILALPRRVRDENPRLSLCLELDWQPGEEPAQGHLVVTRRASGTVATLPDVMSPWDRLHLYLVKTVMLRLKGDYVGALAAADAMDLLLDTDDIAARALGTLAEANYQSGMTRGLGDVQGDRAARAAEATALVRALEGEAEHASGLLAHVDSGTFGTAGLVARALVSIGRLDPRDARHWLARLASSHHDDEFWPFAVHATDRYGLYWGDPVETDADLDRAWAEHGERIVAGSTAQVLLTSDAADLALMLGQQSRAEAALDQCPGRNSWIAVSRARLALLSGSPKHALLFILEAQGRGRTERYGQLDLAVLRAAAEFALGREEDATASLLRAVNQSGKSGVIVPFHLLPHETLHALAALHAEVDRFVRLHGLTGTSYLAPYQKVAGALSERELVVLRALDPAATVEQIAKKLFVASNTVKAQLRSIYRKLNVSTRTEALLVAAELGLLDQASRSA
jgi:LuxR family maltose regulon positive regulatory protein